MRQTAVLWAGLGGLLGLAGCSGGDSVNLKGKGASFPAPLYDVWAGDYCDGHPDVTIDYASAGSGAGERGIINGDVDFAASDAGMPKNRDKVERGVVLLPMTAGCIVLAYNLDGVDELKLPRDAYIGIFTGKVTRWNDAAIKAANPEADLPDREITVIVRADSSGTTYVLTHHLDAAAPGEYRAGVDKKPAWNIPKLQEAPKNAGVAQQISETPGSIGYMELGYAERKGLKYAALENKGGQFKLPTTEAGQAALESAELGDDLVGMVGDPADAAAYPIATYTWVICYEKYDNAKQRETLKDFLLYCLNEGQAKSEELGYIRLPDSVIKKTKEALGRIQ